MKVTSHKNFFKAYARLPSVKQRQIDAALMVFQENRLDASLRDHDLKGKMKGLRAFSAAFDLRVIYREEGGFITVILIDVGTHNQVYNPHSPCP